MGQENKTYRYRWTDLEQDHPLKGIGRRRIIGEQAMIAEIAISRGCEVTTHHHENEQFACVMSGKLRFIIGAEKAGDRYEVMVSAGEVLHLPSNVPHSAEALEDSFVLDVFSPPAPTGLDRK